MDSVSEILHNKRGRSPIISIMGTTAAGKTTLAAEIAKRHKNIVHIEIDKLMKKEPHNEYIQNNDPLYPYREIFLEHLDKGILVIIDFIQIKTCSFAHVIPVLLYMPPSIILNRFKLRLFGNNAIDLSYDETIIKADNTGKNPISTLLNPLRQFTGIYTGDPKFSKNNSAIGKFKIPELRKLLHHYKFLFGDDVDLENYIGKFLINLNVEHTKQEVNVYPRGAFSGYYIINNSQFDEKIKNFENSVLFLIKN